MLLAGLVLELAHDAQASHADASPAARVQLVIVHEDRQEHRENFAGRGDRGAHERLEVGNRVENERLPHRTAGKISKGELDTVSARNQDQYKDNVGLYGILKDILLK